MSQSRRPPEPRHLPTPTRDWELLLLTERHLAECDPGEPDWEYPLGPKTLLRRVIDIEPKLENEVIRKDRWRAYDYAEGMLCWHLDLQYRRPPQGWREGLGTRMLGASNYAALDATVVRVLDFWAFLLAELGADDVGGDEFFARPAGELKALIRRLRELECAPRSRLSLLAEGRMNCPPTSIFRLCP